MFSKLLGPHLLKIDYPCTIEENRSQGQKERRIIDTLEPVLNQHRLVVDATAARQDVGDEPQYSLLYQLTHLTADRGCLRHDDRLDALAQMVAYFADQLARDTAQTEQQHAEKLKQQTLLEFTKKFGLGKVRRKAYHATNRAIR